jgi:polysaccharide export outer membrane protein
VRPDGKVSLPLVNDIQASGLTANELRTQLAQRLSPFIQNPEVSVIVREVNSFKVSVNGNVNMPGQYGVKSEATVLDMIARAQGFNTFADKGSIWVVRRNGDRQEQLKFNYDDAIRARDNANFFVKPGDVIIVN